MGAQFSLHFALRQTVGDLAALELDPSQEVTVSLMLEDQRVVRGALLAFRLRRRRKQAHLCLRVANHQSLAVRGDRLHFVFAGGNDLVRDHEIKWHLATTLVLLFSCAAAIPESTTNVTTTNQFACFINCLRELVSSAGK